MKVSTIFPILASMSLFGSVSADDFSDGVKCGQRFPKINAAIDAFCMKRDGHGKLTNDLMVPSIYAAGGYEFVNLAGKPMKLWISGTCNPWQWVPLQWCTPQFRSICANTKDPRGFAVGHYGNNGCQNFYIGPR